MKQQNDEILHHVNADLTLRQKQAGLTFGTDAFLLSAFVRKQAAGRAADLGSGTGIVALLCARHNKFRHLYAVEIQPSYADLIRRNAADNGLSDTLSVLCRDLRTLTPADTDGELDAVFSNPPYMKTTSGKRNDADEKYIARHEVHGQIADFCRAAGRLLKFGGLFYVVYRPDRLSDLMAALRDAALAPKRMTFVHDTLTAEPSMVLLEAKKGASEGLIVTPPLFLRTFDADGRPGEMTPDARRVYETDELLYTRQKRPGKDAL